MSRHFGTVARGLRSPIVNQGDDLLEIIPQLLTSAEADGQLTFCDGDILCITESIVGRTQGNYASVTDIAHDLRTKIGPQVTKLGLVNPILSRNRFSILLKGFARALDQLVILLSYPQDEVGNPLFDPKLVYKSRVNPWSDTLTEQALIENFGPSCHPFTKVNYIDFYREICQEENCQVEFVFSNHPEEILHYTDDVLVCDIHRRDITAKRIKDAGGKAVLKLSDILNQKTTEHGYNPEYGLLGSNKADEERIKLFPRDCQELVDCLAEKLYQQTGKRIEVMIYGDGAFRDPVGKIWELADPVVSPAFTQGLSGKPHEVKIKYLADSEFHNLSADEQAKRIIDVIRHKKDQPVNDMTAQGTTPRQYTDLLGSLADLISGSGDKGTPFVYIQGYFDNYSDD